MKRKIDLTKIAELQSFLRRGGLHTVCESARCPNKSECFGKKTATFMILGNVCTRNCAFCGVPKAAVLVKPDEEEPRRIAECAKKLGLRHVVVTSVTRDDLADGGARHFARTIRMVRDASPDAIVEVLTPDFKLNFDALDSVLDADPDVFNHNVETVPRLYNSVRHEADYGRSLQVLEYVKKKRRTIVTKSGLMLGLSEKESEVIAVLRDLKTVGCDMIVIGQYFQPTKENIPVQRYVTAEEFTGLRSKAEEMGFLNVAVGPFMRSSYLAKELYQKIKGKIIN